MAVHIMASLVIVVQGMDYMSLVVLAAALTVVLLMVL